MAVFSTCRRVTISCCIALREGGQISSATFSAADAGSVRITASQPVACYLLPPLLAQMRLALPDVQVDLVASNAVSNLLRREADIAVRMLRPTQGSLVARKLADLPIVAAAHASYLQRHGTPQRPQDLLQHRLIGYDRTEMHRASGEMTTISANYPARRATVELGNMESDTPSKTRTLRLPAKPMPCLADIGNGFDFDPGVPAD
mgnify:CR=1 FL=1